MADRIDAAVAAATAPQPEMLSGEPVTLTVIEAAFEDSGRPFRLAVPEDLSVDEAYTVIELVTQIQRAHRRQVATGSAPAERRPRLFVPGR